ncbi:MAG: trypsin-like serine protease, partial [bacterium]
IKTSRVGTWDASKHTTREWLNCPGDSGGPIIDRQFRVVGVHSQRSGDPGNDTHGQAWVMIATLTSVRSLGREPPHPDRFNSPA